MSASVVPHGALFLFRARADTLSLGAPSPPVLVVPPGLARVCLVPPACSWPAFWHGLFPPDALCPWVIPVLWDSTVPCCCLCIKCSQVSASPRKSLLIIQDSANMSAPFKLPRSPRNIGYLLFCWHSPRVYTCIPALKALPCG